MRSVEEKIKVSDSGKLSFRQEVVRKAMVAFKTGEKFKLVSHARMREAIEQYLFEERRDVLRLVTSTARPDDDARQKIVATLEKLHEHPRGVALLRDLLGAERLAPASDEVKTSRFRSEFLTAS